MNSKAVFGLTAGALALGLLAGLALGGNGDGSKQSGPGPSKTVDGVPAGFERSNDGAVAAATAYAGIVQTLAYRPANTWDASIKRISAPEAAERVTAVMKPGLQSLAAGINADAGASSILRGAPLGYHVVSFDGSSASVEVWGVGVIGSGSLEPTASWGTTAVKLKWVKDDWRLADPMSQSNGPTPKLGGDPTPSEAFRSSLKDFKDLDHVPER